MQNFWSRRFAALIIDMVILTLLLWIITAITYPLIAAANVFVILNYWLLLAALLIIGYFTYMEGKNSVTLGKIIMKLRVNSVDGNMNYKKAFLRNLSKILWIPMILDVVLGFISGSSNDRYLDGISKTFVVLSEN